MKSRTDLKIGDSVFRWGSQTYIMGILNVTPDSFSGDGLLNDADWIDAAVRQGIRQAEEGAHIIDIGGESTRPGATPVSKDDERARVIPVIKALAKEIPIPISIDTYKSEIARQAIEAGASIINDVWGLKMDPHMADVAARYKVPIVVMHNRSEPKDAAQKELLGGHYVVAKYHELIDDISQELMASIELARAAGVAQDKIIIDPGIGFGKTIEQNLELVRRWKEFESLGYPILAGPSRKSFVGFTLGLAQSERLEGTAAAVTMLIERGADIVRVHDVKAMRRVAAFTDVIIRSPLL